MGGFGIRLIDVACFERFALGVEKSLEKCDFEGRNGVKVSELAQFAPFRFLKVRQKTAKNADETGCFRGSFQGSIWVRGSKEEKLLWILPR